MNDTHKELFNNLKEAELSGFLKSLHKPVFISKDMPISRRVVSHWHENGLFLFKKGPQQWSKFSVADYLWVALCTKLRAYNMGLSTIKKVRDQCAISAFDLLGKHITHRMETHEPGPIDSDFQDLVNLYRDREKIEKELDHSRFQLFSMWLVYAIQNDFEVLLLIAPDEANTVNFIMLNAGNEDFVKFMMRTVEKGGLFISIQSLLNEFYGERRFRWEETLPLNISDPERKVLNLLREKNIKTITVHFKEDTLNHASIEKKVIMMNVLEFNAAAMAKRFSNTEILRQEGDQLKVRVTSTVMLNKGS